MTLGFLFVHNIPLTDFELERIASEIQAPFPICGNRQMQGNLHLEAIKSSKAVLGRPSEE